MMLGMAQNFDFGMAYGRGSLTQKERFPELYLLAWDSETTVTNSDMSRCISILCSFWQHKFWK